MENLVDMDGAAVVPVVLMVSGGSDSEAMLEMAHAGCLPGCPSGAVFKVLHINHMLRGEQADADEAFVAGRYAELGVAFEARHIDIAARCKESSDGMEAVARAARYEAAQETLDIWCAKCGVAPEGGRIYTAHTLDDRVETFMMRTLVGTGPGGLASIPRVRGRIHRPLLDMKREELREWLRTQHPGQPDERLWREDPTNSDGSNFRSQVRTQLLPVMRQLRPGFEVSLARTMDLIAQEDDALSAQADGIVYRNLNWDSTQARVPLSAFEGLDRPMARRVLRQCLLVVAPDARLESRQIERVLDALEQPTFSTEVDGGLKVRIADGELLIKL